MVERFFRDLTENQLRRGVLTSVEALQERILADIQEHNRQPKPFIWTAKANDILEKVKRAKANLNNSLSVRRSALVPLVYIVDSARRVGLRFVALCQVQITNWVLYH